MSELTSKERAEIIRQGNEAFNNKDYRLARDLFTKAGYKDGLIRLGDYYMYEKRMPLLAYGYYRRAGSEKRIEDIRRRMISALMEWIGKDKFKPESVNMISSRPGPKVDQEGMVSVQVSPILRDAALKILEKK